MWGRRWLVPPQQTLSFKEVDGHTSAPLCVTPALATKLHQKQMQWSRLRTHNDIPPDLH